MKNWDWRQRLTDLLQDPDEAWKRDLSRDGLEPSVTGSAVEPACEVTGEEPGQPRHTAVWMSLALAGRGMVSEPGTGTSLGTYLAHTRHGKRHLREIIGPPERTDPQEAVPILGRVLTRPEGAAPLPDPIALAADLADRFGPNPVAARDAARRWAKDKALAVKAQEESDQAR